MTCLSSTEAKKKSKNFSILKNSMACFDMAGLEHAGYVFLLSSDCVCGALEECPPLVDLAAVFPLDVSALLN